MTDTPGTPRPDRSVLLCFDGSEDASASITRAGALLRPGHAVVVTVWEPAKEWAGYDPATIITAPLTRLASKELDLDEIARDVAQEKLERGIQLAREAGFDPQGRLARGKAWRAICDVANELDASLMVLGARGLSRVPSALLGSVSAAVTVHARRPVLVVSQAEASL